MKKFRLLFQSKRSVAIATVLLFGGLLSLTPSSSGSRSRKQEPKLEEIRERKAKLKAEDIKVGNRTQSLIIVSMQKENDHLNVAVKNVSSKIVTGYDVAVGIGTVGTECLTGDDESNVVHPGEIRREVYPLQSGIEERGIAILAVMFDDGSSEGETKSIQYMQEYRRGMKMHREYAFHSLQKTLNSQTADLSAALNNLEFQVSPLSEDELNKLPPNVKLGFNAEKSRFLRHIQNLKYHLENPSDTTIKSAQGQGQSQVGVEIQKQLITLVERYARTINKL